MAIISICATTTAEGLALAQAALRAPSQPMFVLLPQCIDGIPWGVVASAGVLGVGGAGIHRRRLAIFAAFASASVGPAATFMGLSGWDLTPRTVELARAIAAGALLAAATKAWRQSKSLHRTAGKTGVLGGVGLVAITSFLASVLCMYTPYCMHRRGGRSR